VGQVGELTSADAAAQDITRVVRERWAIEAHHYVT
jgi:hypothetical protein